MPKQIWQQSLRELPFQKLCLHAAVLAAALAAPSTFGATETWVGGTGDWGNAANWAPSVVPNGVDAGALFQGPAGTVTVSSPMTIGSLVFDYSGGGYTIASGSAGMITFTSSTGTATIVLSASTSGSTFFNASAVFDSQVSVVNNSPTANFLIQGSLAGTGDLLFNGPGYVGLSPSSVSAWTGGIEVNDGNVTLYKSIGARPITVNPGGTLSVINSAAGAYTLNGGELLLLSNAISTITLSANSQLAAYGGTETVGPIIGGSQLLISPGNLNVAENVNISGSSSFFTGSLNIEAANVTLSGEMVNAQQVIVGTGSSFTVTHTAGTNATANSVAPGSVLVHGGYFGIGADMGDQDISLFLDPASVLGGILINATGLTMGGTHVLDVNDFPDSSALRVGGNGSIAYGVDIRPDNTTHTLRLGVGGPVSDSGFAGVAWQLTIDAVLTDHDGVPTNLDVNGIVDLATMNTFTGSTTIESGTLQLGNSLALGSGSGTDADGTNVNNLGTLFLNAGVILSGEKVTVNPGGTVRAASTTGQFANPLVMNGGTLGTGLYTDAISGSGELFCQRCDAGRNWILYRRAQCHRRGDGERRNGVEYPRHRGGGGRHACTGTGFKPADSGEFGGTVTESECISREQHRDDQWRDTGCGEHDRHLQQYASGPFLQKLRVN